MRVRARVERFPLREAFTIARGAKTEAVVVVATLEHGGASGRGEAVPYARYGETTDTVLDGIGSQAAWLAGRSPSAETRVALLDRLPAGAARNALDLALWDVEAKQSARRVWDLAGIPAPEPCPITSTIPILSPAATRARAETLADRSLLKLKLGDSESEDIERVRAARAGAPASRLIVDANEGWDLATLGRVAPALAELGVELIEQPLPAASDMALEGWDGPVPLCADESFHGLDVDVVASRYGAVNVKLDKQGGLTGALLSLERARELGLDVMLGSMVATSLGVAPATLLAARARWADLDGALFLREDRPAALRFEDGQLFAPDPTLWG